MKKPLVSCLLLVIALCTAHGLAAAAAPALNKDMREEIVMVKVGSGLGSVELETTIFRPPGPGPFPLVLMNHGKAPGNPAFQGRSRYIDISREFIERGYAVAIPMRRGFSKSGGQYIDGGCNLEGNGNAQADDAEGVLRYAIQQPWVDPSRILVMGQSHGGLTTIALGARNIANVKALVNFAGGLRRNEIGCQWQLSLIDAFADFGKKTKVPSVWFYGANDSYFNPELARNLHAAYTKTGTDAKLIAYGPFKNDSHGMSSSPEGVAIWWPETEALLKKVGLPVEKVMHLARYNDLPATGFANIENVDAIPYIKASGHSGYTVFLQKNPPRAFAISAGGYWGWANGGDNPSERAVANCQAKSSQPCQVYAIDDHVVWSK